MFGLDLDDIWGKGNYIDVRKDILDKDYISDMINKHISNNLNNININNINNINNTVSTSDSIGSLERFQKLNEIRELETNEDKVVALVKGSCEELFGLSFYELLDVLKKVETETPEKLI